MKSAVLGLLLAAGTTEAANCGWAKPHNAAQYPLWPYCNRRPGDGQTLYPYMDDTIPPADVAPYTCTGGKVLRHDSPGLICADYNLGDEFAGPCTDQTCCAEELCSTYTCQQGTLRGGANKISCTFPCNDETCCIAPAGVPNHDAQGFIFVDKDPGLYRFGGQATIIRAMDESDITHYRVYWGFAYSIRKVPSCGLGNPVSWTQVKWRDPTKLFKEFPVTGCDITFDIPMGTAPNERCPISYDRQERSTAHADKCNPHYFLVVSVNQNGEKPVLIDQSQQVGPKYTIVDFEGNKGLPCLEAGITMGHDLMGPDDIQLGAWNGVPTPLKCQELCAEHNAKLQPGGIPCRQFTWSLDNGGRSSESCWIEAQLLQKQHYTVRFISPAVCVTPNGQTPTGKEQPRCSRWIRHQNLAPFAVSTRDAYKNKGPHYVQFPNLPDVPLGKYDNAEYCRNMCDLDALCTGFSWMKKDPTDTYFHKCLLHRAGDYENNLESNIFYDTWVCSRETHAPLISGFTLQKNPYGYKKCSSTPTTTQSLTSYDCCAEACRNEAGCSAFTFMADGTCTTHSDCSAKDSFHNIAGCTYESCFDGFGGATYVADEVKMQIVDRWPLTGKGSAEGITVAVQSNRGLEGVVVHCVASLDLTQVPVTAEDLIAGNSALIRYSATITNGVAKMIILSEYKTSSNQLTPGTYYGVRCMVENALSKGLKATYTELWIPVQDPPGYTKVGNGFCRTSGCNPIGEVPSQSCTFLECKAYCDNAPVCSAFWWRRSDGWCHIKTTACSYTFVNNDNNIQCWKPDSNANVVHYPGDTYCANSCPATFGIVDTCTRKRRMGQYDSNYFLPDITSMNCPIKTAAPTSVPTAVPTVAPTVAPTAVPTAVPTLVPTAVPTVAPTVVPTAVPTVAPTAVPTAVPTIAPTGVPGVPPTDMPTAVPTLVPTAVPTSVPTAVPTAVPTSVPTAVPTAVPTSVPTAVPTAVPTIAPTGVPGVPATVVPTAVPTAVPTSVPTTVPTNTPTGIPGVPPTATPTTVPTAVPTIAPTGVPGVPPTVVPTAVPTTIPTGVPGVPPTIAPTAIPTVAPTGIPGVPPTTAPTGIPGVPPTTAPTGIPGVPPTTAPTGIPGVPPTTAPTGIPGVPPTTAPTGIPGVPPTTAPTGIPGVPPTTAPTGIPGVPPTTAPTGIPGVPPTDVPTSVPGSGNPGNTSAPQTAIPTSVPLDSNGAGLGEEDDSSNNWWIIVIIVVGSLLVCGMIIAGLLYKRKKSNEIYLCDFPDVPESEEMSGSPYVSPAASRKDSMASYHSRRNSAIQDSRQVSRRGTGDSTAYFSTL